MYVMTEEEKKIREESKLLHSSIRNAAKAAPSWEHRDYLLLWGYVRGFKFRRMERTHRVQKQEDGTLFEHNMPSSSWLHTVWKKFIPVEREDINRWLLDPTGAIPAPPPRPKKPFLQAPDRVGVSAE